LRKNPFIRKKRMVVDFWTDNWGRRRPITKTGVEIQLPPLPPEAAERLLKWFEFSSRCPNREDFFLAPLCKLIIGNIVERVCCEANCPKLKLRQKTEDDLHKDDKRPIQLTLEGGAYEKVEPRTRKTTSRPQQRGRPEKALKPHG